MYSTYIDAFYKQVKEKKDRIRNFNILSILFSIIFWIWLFTPIFLKMKLEPTIIFILGLLLLAFCFTVVLMVVISVFSIIINGIYRVYPKVKSWFETSDITNFEEIIFSLVSAHNYLDAASTLKENNEHNKKMAIFSIRTAVSRINLLLKSQLRSEYFEPIRKVLVDYRNVLNEVILIIDKKQDSFTSVEHFLSKSAETMYDRTYSFDYDPLVNFRENKTKEDILNQLLNETSQQLRSILTVRSAARILVALVFSAVITLPTYYLVYAANFDLQVAGAIIAIFSIPLTLILSLLPNPTPTI